MKKKIMRKNETLCVKLKKLDDLNQAKRKIDGLLECDGLVFRTILYAAFSDNINFDLPKGMPPLPEETKIIPKPINDNMIKRVAAAANKSVNKYERERAFTQVLQEVHPEDQKLLIAMKDKTFTDLFPTLTKEFVARAYPVLLK